MLGKLSSRISPQVMAHLKDGRLVLPKDLHRNLPGACDVRADALGLGDRHVISCHPPADDRKCTARKTGTGPWASLSIWQQDSL